MGRCVSMYVKRLASILGSARGGGVMHLSNARDIWCVLRVSGQIKLDKVLPEGIEILLGLLRIIALAIPCP